MSEFTFHCRKLGAPLALTGDPRRQPWSDRHAVGDLTLSNGKGAPAQSTRVWAAWDQDRLYAAFWCEDSDIRGSLTERDDKVWQEEAAEFFLSVDGDLTEYYEFQFSPRNVVRDIKVHNPRGRMEGSVFDGSWNCLGLRSATCVLGHLNDPAEPDQGWGLEAAVPFDCLLGEGIRPAAGDSWRINFFRIYRWPMEQFCSWSPTFVDPWEFHVPEFFGRLIFQAE